MRELFIPGDLLLPEKDLEKWSVIACDQHTSEPEYWESCASAVGDAPSALKMILPEVYLGKNDDERLESIAAESAAYKENGIFRPVPDAYIYVRRQLSGQGFRRGLLGLIDLENYSYEKGSDAPIRSTEGTVLERIPPASVSVRPPALKPPTCCFWWTTPRTRYWATSTAKPTACPGFTTLSLWKAAAASPAGWLRAAPKRG